MEGVVRGCCAGEKNPSMYYMLQKWTDFGAGWKRRPGNDKIPPDVSESTYFVRTRSSICSSSLHAGSDHLSSIYRVSYGRSFNFRLLDELGTS